MPAARGAILQASLREEDAERGLPDHGIGIAGDRKRFPVKRGTAILPRW